MGQSNFRAKKSSVLRDAISWLLRMKDFLVSAGVKLLRYQFHPPVFSLAIFSLVGGQWRQRAEALGR